VEQFVNNLVLGLDAISWTHLLHGLIGCLLGMLIGVLPSIGPAAGVAMLLPVAYALPPMSALIMLAGIYYGAQYGGFIAAILVGSPGKSASVMTVIDGYQMTRKSRAGPALATAGLSAFFAASVGLLILAAVAPPLAKLVVNLGPVEYFSLMVLGLTSAAALVPGSLLKAVGMAVLGLLMGLIGDDPGTGVARFGFGIPALAGGIDLVIIAMGLLCYGEIIVNLSRPATAGEREAFSARASGLTPSSAELRRMVPAVLRGTTLGAVLGILPGGGTVLAAFVAYVVEKKTRVAVGEAPFGKGNVRGVAASESANNAAAQTAFIPLMALGVPSNAVTALLMGSMIIPNIHPGSPVIADHPDLFWDLIASMWIGNAMLILLHLPLIGAWIKCLSVPRGTLFYRSLFPAIVLLCAVGAYSAGHSTVDVRMMAVFGLVGYVFHKLGCEPAPLLLGFILAPMMEDNLHRALLMSGGEWSVFARRPISAGLLLGALLLMIVLMPAVRARRAAAFR
jgi:TctA family transporter